jgi:hypothetical protein
MAKVYLTIDDVNSLPPVCMQCGAAATCVKEKTFSVRYTQGRYGNTIYFLDRSLKVPVPLCRKHRHHWLCRSWLILLGLPALVLCHPTFRMDPNPIQIFLWSVVFLWIVVCFVLRWSMIRVVDIDEKGITLKGVHERFIEAVEKQRESVGQMRQALDAWNSDDVWYPRADRSPEQVS